MSALEQIIAALHDQRRELAAPVLCARSVDRPRRARLPRRSIHMIFMRRNCNPFCNADPLPLVQGNGGGDWTQPRDRL